MNIKYHWGELIQKFYLTQEPKSIRIISGNPCRRLVLTSGFWPLDQVVISQQYLKRKIPRFLNLPMLFLKK